MPSGLAPAPAPPFRLGPAAAPRAASRPASRAAAAPLSSFSSAAALPGRHDPVASRASRAPRAPRAPPAVRLPPAASRGCEGDLEVVAAVRLVGGRRGQRHLSGGGRRRWEGGEWSRKCAGGVRASHRRGSV